MLLLTSKISANKEYFIRKEMMQSKAERAFIYLCKLSIPTYFLPSSRRLTKAIIYASSDLEVFGEQGVFGQERNDAEQGTKSVCMLI